MCISYVYMQNKYLAFQPSARLVPETFTFDELVVYYFYYMFGYIYYIYYMLWHKLYCVYTSLCVVKGIRLKSITTLLLLFISSLCGYVA